MLNNEFRFFGIFKSDTSYWDQILTHVSILMQRRWWASSGKFLARPFCKALAPCWFPLLLCCLDKSHLVKVISFCWSLIEGRIYMKDNTLHSGMLLPKSKNIYCMSDVQDGEWIRASVVDTF